MVLRIFNSAHRQFWLSICALSLLLLFCGNSFGAAKVICIGLTHLDPNHYGGDSGKLVGCDNDAADMQAIGKTMLKYDGTPLLNDQATRANMLAAIRDARSLQSGDILMLTFSGHGGQVPDAKADAVNGMDQTMCLFDGQLLDKELYAEFSHFNPGVRVLVFSDSCHSRGITKQLFLEYQLAFRAAVPKFSEEALNVKNAIEADKTKDRTFGIKELSFDTLVKAYDADQATYNDIIKNMERPKSIPPLVLSISAWGDDETAGDAGFGRNSVFTAVLLKVWNGGNYPAEKTYVDFSKDILNGALAVRKEQHAARRMIDKQDGPYWGQHPFTLAPPP